jgi:hypothetical protein
MHTAGTFTQGKPNTDAEIFISALSGFIAAGAGLAQAALGTSGLAGVAIPASVSGQLQLYPSGLLCRTGVLQTQNFALNSSQNAFGTAEGPGPNSTSGTSGPSGFGPNSIVAPVTAANLPTLVGSVAGAQPKGVQVNWVDFIYQVQTLAATSVHGALSKIVTPVGADVTPVSTVLAASTALSAVVNSSTAKVHRTRVTPTVISFLTDDADTLEVTFSAVTPATSIVVLAGVVLGCSFNFN